MLHDVDVLILRHLNIPVADIDRSSAFYGRWFGFDRLLAEYHDGTRFITDGTGFELALHQIPHRPESATDWHFGFVASDSNDVRHLMASLISAGIRVTDWQEEQGYVGFKCHDPDGYVVEVYWEPRT